MKRYCYAHVHTAVGKMTAVLLLLLPALTATAQQTTGMTSDTLSIHFRLDSVKVDMDYADNATQWQRFEQRFASHYATQDPTAIRLDIYSGASPEGPAAHNRQLGEARGQSLRQLIRERLGQQIGRIAIHNEAARWEGLYDLVAASREPWRDEVLRIIEQPPSKDETRRDHRENSLRSLHNGEVWPVLLRDYLAPLRSGVTAVVSYMAEHDTIFVRDTVFVGPQPGVGTIGGVGDGTGVRHYGEPEYEAVWCWRPYVSLKTNLLFDGLMAPNLEVEVPLGWSRWSVMAEWWTPWYRWHGNNKGNHCYEVLTVGAELRYWLSHRRDATCPRLLTGHFVGIYGAGGKYDVQWSPDNDHEGWQGEYSSYGLTYGYSFYPSRHWRIELSACAGYVGGPQRYYHGMFDDEHLIWQRTQSLRYVGPTKLKFTLAYLLGRPVLRKGERL